MKKEQKIIFPFNNTKHLRLKFIHTAGCSPYSYDYISLSFIDNDKTIPIMEGSLIDVPEMLTALLPKAINNELQLSQSITHDIGFLWNEYLQEKTNHTFEEKTIDNGRTKQWIGLNHLLWNPAHGNSSWLYNDNGNIILEITPTYKWHYSKPAEEESFISYDEFIKNYKPLLTITIPKKVALDWLKQAENLLHEIEANDAKFLRQNNEKSKL